MPETGVNKHSCVAAAYLREHLVRSIFRQSRFLFSASPIIETVSRHCATPVEQAVQVT